jgi:hypothetical protein
MSKPEPHLQNLPVRVKRSIRESFRAPLSQELLRADYATIEQRMLAATATPPQEAPCEPPGACQTHGRCWTHSEWRDSKGQPLAAADLRVSHLTCEPGTLRGQTAQIGVVDCGWFNPTEETGKERPMTLGSIKDEKIQYGPEGPPPNPDPEEVREALAESFMHVAPTHLHEGDRENCPMCKTELPKQNKIIV